MEPASSTTNGKRPRDEENDDLHSATIEEEVTASSSLCTSEATKETTKNMQDRKNEREERSVGDTSSGVSPSPLHHVTRKPRLGDTFSDPRQVQLHGNDFEWDDLWKELHNTAEGALHSQFVKDCNDELNVLRGSRQQNEGGDLSAHRQQVAVSEVPTVSEASQAVGEEDFAPSLTSADTAAAAVGQQNNSNDWEKHYQSNRRHFPVKNYIIHAFPELLPAGRTLDELCASTFEEEEDRLMKTGSELAEPKAAVTSNDAEPAMTTATVVDEDRRGAAAAAATSSASSSAATVAAPRLLIEAGCGTGSVVHPLMKLFPSDCFICFDVSPTAVAMLAEHSFAKVHRDSQRLATFAHDLSRLDDSLTTKVMDAVKSLPSLSGPCRVPRNVCRVQADVITLVFVLCAMPSLSHMRHVLAQLASYLNPETGVLCFRDYGALDHNFFRFYRQKNERTESLMFQKGDGTTQFFFEKDITIALFELAGLVPKSERSVVYHCNRLVNRKNGKRMDKVFLNGSFVVKKAS